MRISQEKLLRRNFPGSQWRGVEYSYSTTKEQELKSMRHTMRHTDLLRTRHPSAGTQQSWQSAAWPEAGMSTPRNGRAWRLTAGNQACCLQNVRCHTGETWNGSKGWTEFTLDWLSCFVKNIFLVQLPLGVACSTPTANSIISVLCLNPELQYNFDPSHICISFTIELFPEELFVLS